MNVRHLAVAALVALPIVGSAMPSFPITLAGTAMVPIVGTQSFTARLRANGTGTIAGQQGSWSYDAATQTLTITHPQVTATGVRSGTCFSGTAIPAALPIPVPWSACVVP